MSISYRSSSESKGKSEGGSSSGSSVSTATAVDTGDFSAPERATTSQKVVERVSPSQASESTVSNTVKQPRPIVKPAGVSFSNPSKGGSSIAGHLDSVDRSDKRKGLLSKIFGSSDAPPASGSPTTAEQLLPGAFRSSIPSPVRPASPVSEVPLVTSPFSVLPDRHTDIPRTKIRFTLRSEDSGSKESKTSVIEQPWKSGESQKEKKASNELKTITDPGLDSGETHDFLVKRHDELIDSVNDICRALQQSETRKVEVNLPDDLPAYPVENIDSLNRSQKEMSLALGEICSRMESASRRDEQMIDSMVHLDKRLTTMSRVSERTHQTLVGLKVVMGDVSESLESVRSEVRLRANQEYKLKKEIAGNDLKHSRSISKLQRRSGRLTMLLGLGLIGSLTAVIILLQR